MSDAIPLNPCPGCGGNSEPHDIVHDGDVIATGMACKACVDRWAKHLASVRPVLDAMIACGVDRVVANETMTFLLERHEVGKVT